MIWCLLLSCIVAAFLDSQRSGSNLCVVVRRSRPSTTAAMKSCHHCSRSVLSMFSWRTTLSISGQKNSSVHRQFTTGHHIGARTGTAEIGVNDAHQQHMESSGRGCHIMIYTPMLSALATPRPSRHRVRVHRSTYSIDVALPDAQFLIPCRQESPSRIIRIYVCPYQC
jgi:hypothetical protein